MSGQINNLSVAKKSSHFLQIFAISGSAGMPKVDFRYMKKAAIEHSYPEPAKSYIRDLPDEMDAADFIRELATIDRLLKMRA